MVELNLFYLTDGQNNERAFRVFVFCVEVRIPKNESRSIVQGKLILIRLEASIGVAGTYKSSYIRAKSRCANIARDKLNVLNNCYFIPRWKQHIEITIMHVVLLVFNPLKERDYNYGQPVSRKCV